LPSTFNLGAGGKSRSAWEFGHEVDLAAPLQNVDAFLGCNHRITIKVGGALLELGEVFDGL
jgi:hypothetical protein